MATRLVVTVVVIASSLRRSSTQQNAQRACESACSSIPFFASHPKSYVKANTSAQAKTALQHCQSSTLRNTPAGCACYGTWGLLDPAPGIFCAAFNRTECKFAASEASHGGELNTLGPK